jgi:hypothetical protein
MILIGKIVYDTFHSSTLHISTYQVVVCLLNFDYAIITGLQVDVYWVEMCGTKKIILHRDRDRDQLLNPRLHDGLNSVNFCTSEVTLFEKKEPKNASRRLNKLKKTSIEEFFRWNFEL